MKKKITKKKRMKLGVLNKLKWSSKETKNSNHTLKNWSKKKRNLKESGLKVLQNTNFQRVTQPKLAYIRDNNKLINLLNLDLDIIKFDFIFSNPEEMRSYFFIIKVRCNQTFWFLLIFQFLMRRLRFCYFLLALLEKPILFQEIKQFILRKARFRENILLWWF
jgi:hypothetical protein